jgi:hypothetical protein
MIRTFLALPLLAAIAIAQNPYPRLELTEVLVDPIGPNAGNQIVEITVNHTLAVDATGFQLVSWPNAAPFPPITLPTDQILRLHLGTAGMNTIADLFFPTMPVLTANATLAIYDSNQFTNATSLVDFVSWGGGTGLIQQAVQAQRWPSTLVSAVLPSQEGATLANRTFARWTMIGPDAWYRDTTPTLGLPNDPGATFNVANACTMPAFPPEIFVSGFDAGPWLGETYRLDFSYLPPSSGTLLLVLGAAQIGPLDLAAFGMPNCAFYVRPDAVLPVPFAQGTGSITLLVPALPQLVGFRLYMQAFVPDPQAGNAALALVSNAMVGIVGSR